MAVVPAPPRPVVRRAAWAAAGVAAVAVVWLAAAQAPPIRQPVPGPWSVSVAAGHGDLTPCTRDPAVVDALAAAVAPPGATSVRLVAQATSDDLDRVVACVARHAGTEVAVVGPAG